MSWDYLDLLIARETRAAPLAEPRIAAGAAALAPSPTWGEISEDGVVDGEPPPVAGHHSGIEVGPSFAQVEPPARKGVPVLPPRLEERLEHTPAPAGQSSRPREAPPLTLVKEAQPERRIPDTPTHAESARVEFMKPAAKTAEPAPGPVQTDRWFPPVGLRQPPDDPLEIPTRRMDSAPELPPPPLTPQPVTIRIDRIEVRAASPAAPTPLKARPGPRLGLDEYLKRRSGGGQ